MAKRKKYALLAGVEEYQPNSRISNLKYAARDAVEQGKALRRTLTSLTLYPEGPWGRSPM